MTYTHSSRMTPNLELLYAAARAAEYEVVGFVDERIVFPRKDTVGGLIIRNERGGDSAWNPLTSDGDAFRLATKLGMWLRLQEPINRVVAVGHCGFVVSVDEEYVDDPYAAARLAIVKVAATMAGAKE